MLILRPVFPSVFAYFLYLLGWGLRPCLKKLTACAAGGALKKAEKERDDTSFLEFFEKKPSLGPVSVL